MVLQQSCITNFLHVIDKFTHLLRRKLVETLLILCILILLSYLTLIFFNSITSCILKTFEANLFYIRNTSLLPFFSFLLFIHKTEFFTHTFGMFEKKQQQQQKNKKHKLYLFSTFYVLKPNFYIFFSNSLIFRFLNY